MAAIDQEVDTAPNFAPLTAKLHALGPVVTGNIPYWMGVLRARMGQTDSAFVWLGRAYEARHLNIVALRSERSGGATADASRAGRRHP